MCACRRREIWAKVKYPGPVESAVKKYSRYILRSHGITDEKHMARRAYRRVNKLTMAQIELDPDLYEGEIFDAPTLSSWDVW
jgi:hypothetical protein